MDATTPIGASDEGADVSLGLTGSGNAEGRLGDGLPPGLANASYRACSPAETFERVSPFLLRLGITRLARQTDLDRIGIPVWCAVAPNARAIVIAQGKGLDDHSARTSAAMEAIERSVATRPACTIVEDTRRGLEACGHMVDPLDCLVAAGEQPVSPDEKIRWTQARHLVTGATVWLPFDAIHLDRTEDGLRFWQSSDGLASGNTCDEAVLHGLLERVERDALVLWQVKPPSRRYNRRIDPLTLADDTLQALLNKIDGADLDLALFDMTSDTGVASIAAILGPRSRVSSLPIRHVDVTLGCGCSLSPTVAVARAMTEAVQSRMTFIAGARDDLLPHLFQNLVCADTLAAFDAAVQVSLSDVPHRLATSTKDALAQLVGRLSTMGAGRLYAVDLAPDWLPVSVVKVIAPQLENPDGDRRQRFGARALSQAFA